MQMLKTQGKYSSKVPVGLSARINCKYGLIEGGDRLTHASAEFFCKNVENFSRAFILAA